MISVAAYSVSITEVELRTDLLGTAVDFARLAFDQVAQRIEGVIWADFEAQQERDQLEEAQRRAAGPAYHGITDDIITRLEQLKSTRPLTTNDINHAIAEHKRRCALVNPPRRVCL